MQTELKRIFNAKIYIQGTLIPVFETNSLVRKINNKYPRHNYILKKLNIFLLHANCQEH